MAYKWRPNRTQAREFAKRMSEDKDFVNAYNKRKEEKAKKRRQSSNFDYTTAGGNFIPTQYQYDNAFKILNGEIFYIPRDVQHQSQIDDACNQVIYGYSCQEKIHHDYIHVVNEIVRNQ